MIQTTCPICSKPSGCICDAVTRFFSEPEYGFTSEQRDADRVPFFRPVRIGLNDGEPPRFPAFTRDLSVRGIGLLHLVPLACGEVIVRISGRFGELTDLRVYIEWCEDCGEGWYISGGHFLSVEP